LAEFEPATRHRLMLAVLNPAFAVSKKWCYVVLLPVIGLKDVFGNTSDPRYFVEFETQARTLQLVSGPVEEALNIRLLVGEPGVGKTALLLRLLQQVHSTVLTTRLFWTQLRRNEFVHYFLRELGVRWPLTSL